MDEAVEEIIKYFTNNLKFEFNKLNKTLEKGFEALYGQNKKVLELLKKINSNI